MKLVPCRKLENISTYGISLIVLRDSSQRGGCDFDEMGQRVDLIKKIKEFGEDAESFLLEDAEHSFLTALLTKFKFIAADEDLYEIIKDVKNAEKPSNEGK